MFQNEQFVYFIPVLLAVLVLLYVNSRRKRRLRVRKLTELKDDQSPQRNHCYIRSRLKVTFVVLGFTFLLIALARPQFGYEWKDQQKITKNILIILDISHSMLVTDVYPNRLERSKLLIRELVESQPGAKIGLLVFAGDSFLQCPITEDHSALLDTLREQTTSLITEQGSDYSKMFMKLPDIIKRPKHDKIILFSDGEDHSIKLRSSIEYLINQGIKVNTICIGTPKGGLIPNPLSETTNDPYFYDAQGNVVFSKADPQHLKSIADELKGSFIHFDSEGYSMRELNQILIDDRPELQMQLKKKRIPVEYYQIPLLFAFICFCVELSLGTRKPSSQKS